MKLRATTITGADNSSTPGELAHYSCVFDFVEWGILLYDKTQAEGRPRYPDARWILELNNGRTEHLRLSGHICGTWAKCICAGQFPEGVDVRMFQRVQLNVAEYLPQIRSIDEMARCLPQGPEYILQVGTPVERGVDIARQFRRLGINMTILFDASAGRGIPPDEWPEPPQDIPCGFAGGLGPRNLAHELGRLCQRAGDLTIWIDMETHVRTHDGERLDFNKVRQCLCVASAFAT